MKVQRFEYRQLSIVLVLMLAACSASSVSASLPPSLSEAVSGKVDVGGYELYYICVGEGSPTVILEAGNGNDTSVWDLTMLYYQKYTRICAYDRANLGKSDRAATPRTYEEMNRDLHALLRNAPIEAPYVLVGFSMGGMLVRRYAGQYPEGIVGVVLVDSFHPDAGACLSSILPPKMPGEDKGLELWREYAQWAQTSTGKSRLDPEDVNNLISMEQARAVQSLGDIPLAVISRNPENTNIMPGMPTLPDEINTQIMQLWQDLQADLEGLSTNSTRYTAARSNHGIPYYEPRLVVDAIRHVVDEYRAQTGIPVPSVSEGMDAASHVPVITGIRERQKWESGILSIYEEISYTDPAGDAITIINQPISAPITSAWMDDIILASAAEQQKGTVLTTRVARCRKSADIVLKYRVFDTAGNTSKPEIVSFACPPPRPYLNPFVIGGTAIALPILGFGIQRLTRIWRKGRAVVV
jgi:pimeloyl-ACP methyl ester carboxylesterase